MPAETGQKRGEGADMATPVSNRTRVNVAGRLRRRLAVAATVAAVAVSMVAAAKPVLAADPVVVEFSYTGAAQSFAVPDGVTSIHVVAVGGKGGRNTGANVDGGFGARVVGDLTVTAGQTLHVFVGDNGATAQSGGQGGFNGGGDGGPLWGSGGGGASDIRTLAGDASTRLIVAAGGGGAGANTGPGRGGDASSDGGDAQDGSTGGSAGTSSAGGAGGHMRVFLDEQFDWPSGEDGSVGKGGKGGAGDIGGGYGGGGGGGGYYGGGGGGAGYWDGPTFVVLSGGGGGGGSSFTGDATNATVTTDDTGVPKIRISYSAVTPDSGTVDADVTVPTSASCIQLSTTSISFGTQRLGSENAAATPSITVTNCSGNDATLLAHGSDATAAGVTWNLVDDAGSCGASTLAPDDFHLKLHRADTEEVTQLATNNKTVRTLGAGAEGTLDALIDMPCPGSSGAGETMAMQIVFVVTE
jgi:hypothetical protein